MYIKEGCTSHCRAPVHCTVQTVPSVHCAHHHSSTATLSAPFPLICAFLILPLSKQQPLTNFCPLPAALYKVKWTKLNYKRIVMNSLTHVNIRLILYIQLSVLRIMNNFEDLILKRTGLETSGQRHNF